MKKLILTITVAAFSIISASAQELIMQQFCFYYGQPKTVKTYTMGQYSTIEFDRLGRVLSKAMGTSKIIYSWSADGKSVECTGYNDGQMVGTSKVRVFEMSENRCSYESDGISYVVTFRSNGTLNKMTMSGNGQSMSQTYYYENSTDIFPNKMIMSGGGQSLTVYFSNVKTDSHGNPISLTQSAQGQSVINSNTITYY